MIVRLAASELFQALIHKLNTSWHNNCTFIIILIYKYYYEKYISVLEERPHRKLIREGICTYFIIYYKIWFTSHTINNFNVFS